MSPRRPLVVGNWKMHKTAQETRALVAALRALPLPDGVDVVVAPPFTSLWAAAEALKGSSIGLAAQTMHEADHGPHTGEISPDMILETGAKYVILGHSERRLTCGEDDMSVNRKVRSALAHGLIPVVAVGDTADEHERGEALPRVISQTRIAFDGVEDKDVAGCVLAYEPIWAIGTGKVDDPDNADRTIGEIRNAVPGLASARLLYGGSMKPENAAALLARPNIDGGLIGGASLQAASFAAIVQAAAERVPK